MNSQLLNLKQKRNKKTESKRGKKTRKERGKKHKH